MNARAARAEGRAINQAAHNTATDGPKVVATYKEYRITAYGAKRFRIYKPEGGLFTSMKFDSIEDCELHINVSLAYDARCEAMKQSYQQS